MGEEDVKLLFVPVETDRASLALESGKVDPCMGVLKACLSLVP